MDNFNLKKFLTENKLTHTSHLREGFHSPTDPNTVAYNKVKSEWDAGNISDRRYTNMKWMDLPDEVQKELYNKYNDDYYENTMDVDTSGETYDYEMNEVVVATEMTTQETSGHAERFAKYMSDKEGKTFTVTAGSVDGPSFDLDLDGEKYEGGSFLISQAGEIINMALPENPVYGNISMLEGKKEYYKNAEADDAEHIKALDKDMKDDKKSSKMKESQLRSKIKEMVLAEMNLNISDETPESAEDFLAEIENMLNGVDEAKKDKEEVDTEEATDDITVDDTETIDTTTTTEVDPDVKEVQDALTQAQAAAQKLGDPKLTDQIGNTITFFTRAHIVEKGAVAEGKEMEEGYFGANNEVEELIDALEYETMDEFLNDNPGVVTAILDWAARIPEFRAKMETSGLLEAKKEDMDEAMFPMLKRILKSSDLNEAEGKLVDEETGEEVTLPYKTLDFRGNPMTVISFRAPHKSSSSGRITTKEGGEYFPSVAGLKIIDHSFSEDLNESMFPMLKRILKSSDLNEDLNMSNTPEIENIISLLQGVDGETMEYILRQVGIEDQMKKQLSGETDDDEDEYNDMYHPKGFDI